MTPEHGSGPLAITTQAPPVQADAPYRDNMRPETSGSVKDDKARPTLDGNEKPKRRRAPRRQTVTVCVEEGLLRMATFSGKNVIAWGTIDLNRGEDMELPLEVQAALNGKGAHVFALPFQAALIRYMETPKIKRRFLPHVVTSEIGATIPFEMDEVDFQWRQIKTTSGNGWRSKETSKGPREIAATAVPIHALDSHAAFLREFGVRPSAAFAKAAALALAAGHPDAIVAHLLPQAAELVLVRDGVPRATHRVDTPRQEQAEAYATAVSQAAYELLESESPSLVPAGLPAAGPAPNDADAGTEAPETASTDGDASSLASGPARGLGENNNQPVVVLSGTLPEGAAWDLLLERLPGPVLPAQSPIGYPEEFPAALYAANIGLAVANTRAAKRGRGQSAADQALFDLLPSRLQRKHTFSWRRLGIALALAGVTLAAVGSTYAVSHAQAYNAMMDGHVFTLERQAVAAQREMSQATADSRLVPQLNNAAEAVQSRQQELAASISSLIERIETVINPDGSRATVSQISVSDSSMTMSIQTNSRDAVVQYAHALRETGLFEQVTLGNVTGGAPGDPTASG
ncbi:MAG: hypothetical protein WD533_03490, partial [Dehalococcoidia bacterium]